MTPLTLEQLQANLRRLAERLEFGMSEDYCDDILDLDAVAYMLCGLAEGVTGDAIADGLKLPETDMFEDEDEHDEDDTETDPDDGDCRSQRYSDD